MPSPNNSGDRSANPTARSAPGLRTRKKGVIENIKASTKKATNALMQQRLKSWQPVLTPKWVMGSFGGIGLIFVALGAVLLAYSESVVEISSRYDDRIATNSAGSITLEVPNDMEGPVYVYYELTNFYQNHRKYVKSRDDDQLAAGDSVSTSAGSYSSNCDPWYESSYELGSKWTNKQLYPCGLVARSVFNDTFLISHTTPSGNTGFTNVVMDESPGTISWPQDVEKKFNQANPVMQTSGGQSRLYEDIDMWILKTFPPQICIPTSYTDAPTYTPVATRVTSSGMPVVDCDFSVASPTCNFNPPCTGNLAPVANPAGWGIDNAHFINWMRTAGLSTFRKLYGKINQSFKKGDEIKVGIQSNFPVGSYSGTKKIVLSTTTWAGGRNSFLGISYIVVGSLLLIFTAVYTALHLKRPRRLVDLDYLDWGESH